ncbi:MAG: VCBS repeat-containing protein [Candidatus Eisenbacteria bacterium]
MIRPIGLAIIALALLSVFASAEIDRFVSDDGQLVATSDRRLATEADRNDPGYGPDGWVQAEPRETARRGDFPLPATPDWVGTRVRAVGGMTWFDADHDGDLDLFVGTYFANSQPPIADYYNFIYLNDGGMLESEPSWIASAQRHTTDARWGFINGDAYPDLVVGNGGSSLQASEVYYGLDGLLATTPSWQSNDSDWTVGIALGDIDGDGDLDLATANQGNTLDPYRPTRLFRNNGSGFDATPFWASQQVGITNSADFADMNGDGRLDLAVAGWSSWETGVFLNLGTTLDTGFAWTTGHPERTDKGIGWAAANLDTLPDLAVGGNGFADRWHANLGGTLDPNPAWASTESYHGCQELQWIDIDNDGDDDLATIHFGNGHTRIYLNNDGVFATTPDWVYDSSSSGSAMAFGDVNGDGWLDLAIGVANGPVILFLNQGSPASAPETSATLPGQLDVRITPNPGRGARTVSLSSPIPFRIESLELIDASGRRISSLPVDIRGTDTRWSFPLPQNVRGVAFLRARGWDRDGRRLHGQARVIAY